MKAKYTKKAFDDIFNHLVDDDDFLNLFRDYWGKIYPNKNLHIETERIAAGQEYKKILSTCITDYLYNFDYLDVEYLDISWLRIKQYGRACLVDLYTIYDIFKSDLRDKFNAIINTIKEIAQDIENEIDISYGEIVFLQEHTNEIKKYFPDDARLWEMAGISESEWNKRG